MTLISATLGYMIMIAGRSVIFGHLFCIYAFSSGVTRLASWMPLFSFYHRTLEMVANRRRNDKVLQTFSMAYGHHPQPVINEICAVFFSIIR